MAFSGIWDWLKGFLGSSPAGEGEAGERSPASTSRTEPSQVVEPVSSQPSGVSPPSASAPAQGSREIPTSGRPRVVSETSAIQNTQKKPTRRETTDLIIGLDFGTAATKVVVRSPYLRGQRSRAISFEQLGHKSSPYLLPTRLRVAHDGSIHLGGNLPGVWQTNLKVALLDREKSQNGAKENSDPLSMASAYLALVMREARERYLRAEQEIYRRFDIRWAVNVGIPSSGYDDQTIRADFLLVARLAWQLSWQEGAINLGQVSDLIRRRPEGNKGADLPVAVIPEVVAQAVGYARSPLRDTGLHVLIDVGAATLDVCGFVLRDAEGQDCYDLLTASVERLGAFELHQQRLAALQCKRDRQKENESDPLIPLPETLAEYHPGCSCAVPNVDADFRAKVARVITRDLALLKKHRDPYSDKFKAGLSAFLCGGGGMMGFFRVAAEEADEEFRKGMIAEPLRLRTLPKPEGLVNRDIDESLFHRLSVGYGLSFDSSNIGSVTPPGDLEDIEVESKKREYEQNFVSKDKV